MEIEFVEEYSKMLTLQADISYPFEKIFFENHYWKRAKNIADIGCGNGHFTALLSDEYPNKLITATDKNKKLIDIANQYNNRENINYYSLSYNEFCPDSKFDFIFSRLMVNQLPDRRGFLTWAYNLLNENGALLIIDADDDNFHMFPELSCFNEVENKTKRKINDIGCRNTKNVICEEASNIGFKENRFITISPNSSVIDKTLFYRYMLYTAKFEEGDNLSPVVYKELFEWYDDEDSFAQYGLYAGMFIKEEI